MKMVFGVLVLLALGTVFWPQAAATPAKTLATIKANAPVVAPSHPQPPVPGGLSLLRAHDLALLLQARNPTCNACDFRPLNGFYGPTRYRIELALVHVVPDAHQPTLYHVQGKSLYKKAIASFSGTITLTQVVKQPTYSAHEIAESADWSPLENLPNMYTAIGQYEWRETTTQRGAGVYRGTVALDFTINKDGLAVQKSQTSKTLTQGGEVKYAGTWTSNTTKRVVPVTWVGDFLGYRGPQGFSDFNIGDRGISINPKYAHLGWNNFWENDEWWADTSKSTTSL